MRNPRVTRRENVRKKASFVLHLLVLEICGGNTKDQANPWLRLEILEVAKLEDSSLVRDSRDPT